MTGSGGRRQRRAALIGLAAAVLMPLAMSSVSGATARAADAPLHPAQDPFYTYSGTVPLAQQSPGAVLATRTVPVNLGASSTTSVPTPLTATQVLYRTTNQIGGPDATVATILQPVTAPVGDPTVAVTSTTKLLSYQTFYDGVSPDCRPSFNLQGGATTSVDVPFILSYLEQGYTVVTTDYEGSNDGYGAGRQSGRAVLDGIRAATHALGMPVGQPVGLVGYSGGATASEWAAEVQPTYAPDLDILGDASGGIPNDFAHNLAYINGTSDWAGAIPAIMIGLFHAYHADMSQYFNASAMTIFDQVSQGCLNASAYPGLTLESLLKPQYQDWRHVPIFQEIFNDSIMSSYGTPAEPQLYFVGNADGTGDGVMIALDVQELAYTYCQRGVNVSLTVEPGLSHVPAAVPFEAAALAWLASRYAGVAATNGCDSITPGNPLTPLAATPPPAATSPPAATPAAMPGTTTASATATKVYRTTSLRVGGRGPVNPQERRTYTLRLFADPGNGTAPSLAGRPLGLYVDGKLRARLKTGAHGQIAYSLTFPRGNHLVTAVFYGTDDLRKSTSPGQKVRSD